jgi:hypothetical protein
MSRRQRRTYPSTKSRRAYVGGRFRSRILLAFDKANLFPLPRFPEFRPVPVGKFGKDLDRSDYGVIHYTAHLRKSRAYRELSEVIAIEAESLIYNKERSASPVNVIWRHTGFNGNFAKFFLVQNSCGRFWLRTKLLNRWTSCSVDYDHQVRDLLNKLPSFLVRSAVMTFKKFEKTGTGIWFPQSRSRVVRDTFPRPIVTASSSKPVVVPDEPVVHEQPNAMCPVCGAPGYDLIFVFQCSNGTCQNFSGGK